MRKTGQWTVEGGYVVYVSGDDIRRLIPSQDSSQQRVDPSQTLVEAAFEGAERVGAGVYDRGTLLWKDSYVYFKRSEDAIWIRMRKTGQWTVEGGYVVYVSGDDIRRKK